MIAPDAISWPAFLVIAPILWVSLLVVVFRSAAPDPDPEYSRLDCLDGLDSRTD